MGSAMSSSASSTWWGPGTEGSFTAMCKGRLPAKPFEGSDETSSATSSMPATSRRPSDSPQPNPMWWTRSLTSVPVKESGYRSSRRWSEERSPGRRSNSRRNRISSPITRWPTSPSPASSSHSGPRRRATWSRNSSRIWWRMADRPAILGGPPAFEKTFPIIRPSADEAATPGLSDRMHAVLQSNMLSNVGIYVKKLEEELERRLRVDHVVATSSCTLGLILVLQALGLRGKRAAVPSFTFNATGLACYWTSNEIDYVDVDDTLTVDTTFLSALRGKVDFLLPVHLYGNPCDVDGLQEWAARGNAPIVYDAAHALGSVFRVRPIGGFWDAVEVCLHPPKLASTCRV